MGPYALQTINNQQNINKSTTNNKRKEINTQATLINKDKRNYTYIKIPDHDTNAQKEPTNTTPTPTIPPHKRLTRNIPVVSFCFCDCFYTLKHLSTKPTHKGFTYLSFTKNNTHTQQSKDPTTIKLTCLQILTPFPPPHFTPISTRLVQLTLEIKTTWLQNIPNTSTIKSFTSITYNEPHITRSTTINNYDTNTH